MQKEKLTISNIKTDLWNETKGSCVELIALTLFLLALIVIMVLVPIVIYKVLFGCLAMIAFWLVAKRASVFISLYSVLHNTPCVVKDKLVGMEEKEHHSRYSRYKTHYLHFSGYGAYKIPNVNYKWSLTFAMNDRSVYEYYSNYGDEFYLVLSKPHTGKILLAYNTKMFELE